MQHRVSQIRDQTNDVRQQNRIRRWIWNEVWRQVALHSTDRIWDLSRGQASDRVREQIWRQAFLPMTDQIVVAKEQVDNQAREEINAEQSRD